MEGGNKTKCHSLPLLFPSWVNISLGIPWFSSIAVFEGKEEELSQKQRTKGRDGVPPETQWAASFSCPWIEVSALRICPTWPKAATRLSRFPQDILRQLLSTSNIQACDLSHHAVIFFRNTPCVTPVLKHRPKDALHRVGGSSHVHTTLLGSVWNCSSTVFEEDREIALISIFKNIFSNDITTGSKKQEAIPFVCTIQKHQSQPSSWQPFEIQCLRPEALVS